LPVGDEGLEGGEEVLSARGKPVADGDRRGWLDDPVDQADLLELFQARGQHAVRQAVDPGDDLGEPAGAARDGEEDAAVPAAADPFDDGRRAAAFFVIDQVPAGVMLFDSHLPIVSHLPSFGYLALDAECWKHA
jgi:hypothetical protein